MPDQTLAYYERNADAYAAATAGADMGRQHRSFLRRLPQRARVLDAGCGAGRDLVRFRRAGLRPTGLDLSPALAAIARARAGVALVVGDLRHPPFQNGAFDGVWASASLVHLHRSELSAALLALASVLVSGGILFSSVKAGRGEGVDDTGRWFSYYQEQEWGALVEASGFRVVELCSELAQRRSVGGFASVGWITSLCRKAVA